MRIKAVPVEAITSNRMLLLAGAAALAVGGVFIYQQRSNASPASPGLTADASTLGAVYTGDPMSFSGGYGPATSSGADALGSISPTVIGSDVPTQDAGAVINNGAVFVPSYAPPSYDYPTGFGLLSTPAPGQSNPFPNPTGIDPATAEILAQQRLAMEYDYQFGMAQLQYNTRVAEANTWLQYQSLMSLEFQSASNLAATFMLSNNQATMGAIYGSDGMPILDMSFVNMRDSKKDRWNETIVQNFGAISSGFTGSRPATPAPQPRAQPGLPWGWGQSYDPYQGYTPVTPATNPTPVAPPPNVTVTGWTPPSIPTATVVNVAPVVNQPSLTPSPSPTYNPVSDFVYSGESNAGYNGYGGNNNYTFEV